MPCEHYKLCPVEIATWEIDSVQIAATVHCERCDTRFPLIMRLPLTEGATMPSLCDETPACPKCGTVFALLSAMVLQGSGALQRQISDCPPMEQALCKSNSLRKPSRLLN